MAVKKKRSIILCVLAAVVLTALSVWVIWGNKALELTPYTITSERLPTEFDGCRIAHISDLHNTQIGRGNEKLLDMLNEAKPDIIVITGDLVDSRRTNIEAALHFAEEAMAISPCFYVPGNHEARLPEYRELKARLMALGVVVLQNERVTIKKDGASIALLGLADPDFAGYYSMGNYISPEDAIIRAHLNNIKSKNGEYSILLSHRPEFFELYTEADIDLIFSGHAHGGQIRLPFVGGLFTPDQGFFPKYDAGLFAEGNTNMIISRGIGNSAFPVRINNRPEVILAELRVG